MNTRILLGLTLSVAIGVAAKAAPASQAAPAQMSESGVISVAVPISDLNLSTPDGAKAVLGRLRHAATVACGGPPETRLDLASVQAFNACIHASLDAAVDQVRAPLVDALYRGHDEAMASAGGPG
jgi:UrcA family protein